jgi:hypothetical protein
MRLGAKRMQKPRSLTAREFPSLLKELREPFATMALVSVCLELRIGETLGAALVKCGLARLADKQIRLGILNQIVAEVKTEDAATSLKLAPDLLDA